MKYSRFLFGHKTRTVTRYTGLEKHSEHSLFWWRFQIHNTNMIKTSAWWTHRWLFVWQFWQCSDQYLLLDTVPHQLGFHSSQHLAAERTPVPVKNIPRDTHPQKTCWTPLCFQATRLLSLALQVFMASMLDVHSHFRDRCCAHSPMD